MALFSDSNLDEAIVTTLGFAVSDNLLDAARKMQ
jgi:hypothetical protein